MNYLFFLNKIWQKFRPAYLPLPSKSFHFVYSHAKYEHVFLSHLFTHFHISTIQSANGEGAVSLGMERVFGLRNKTCSPCFHSLVKTKAHVWENSNADPFPLLKNSHKLWQGFHQTMKARWRCFISFIKLSFSDYYQIERQFTKSICIVLFISWNFKFSKLGDNKSYRSCHFCATQRYENTLAYQSKRMYYPNYFINRKNNTHVISV